MTLIAQFIGDGSTAAFTYPSSPAVGSDLLVVEVDGKPVPYSKNGFVLTLSPAPPNHSIVSVKAVSENIAAKKVLVQGIQTPDAQSVNVQSLAGATASYPKTSDGTITHIAADADNARLALVIVKCTETFATGSGAKPTFKIGVTGAVTSFADTTEFSGLSAGAMKVYAGAVAATKAVLVTATDAEGTGAGALSITVIMLPAVG